MKKEFLKSLMVYGVASGIRRSIMILLLPIYTKAFAKDVFGEMDVIQSMVYILVVFGIVQLESSLQRYYYEVIDSRRKLIISTILWTVVVLSIFISLIISVLSEWLSLLFFSKVHYNITICMASWLIPLSNISAIFFVILRYMRKPFVFGILTVTHIALTVIFSIWFILDLKMGVNGVFLAQIISFFIITIIQLIYLRDMYSFAWSKTELKIMFRFALPQLPARIGSTSNAYINRFFLLGLLTTNAIGIYSVAAKIASSIQLVQSAFMMAWVPFMYKTLNLSNSKSIFKKVFDYVSIGIGYIVVLIALYAKEIITLFTQPEYYDAQYLVGGLAYSTSLYLIKEVIDIGAKATKKTQFISYAYGIAFIVNVLTLYSFIQIWGLKGVVFSLIITSFVLTFVSWIFSNKLYPINYNKTLFIIVNIITLLVVLANMFFNLLISIKILISIILLIMVILYYKKRIGAFLEIFK